MRNECYFAILLSAAEDLGITWVVAGFFVWSIHYQLPLLRYPYNPLSLCHITLPPSPSYLPISSISSLYLSQPILIFLPKYLNIIAADTGAVSVLSFSWKNFNRDRSSPERRRRVEDVGNDVSATPLFRVVVKNDASRANWKLDKKHFKRANHLFIFVY